MNKNDSPGVFRGVQRADGRDPEDVFVSRRLYWGAAGPAFGGLPRLANHKACRDELRAIFATENSFEAFEGKILTGPEFAERLPLN